ncbi:MAG: DUF362 domain-containing protein [Burkholderiales bacterium]|nr:DUF362 domain-containing protein [Burkholderiales bacterium]
MALTREAFLKSCGALALLWQTTPFAKLITESIQQSSPVIGCKQVVKDGPGVAKVYFTKHIDSDHLVKLYSFVNEGIKGRVGIKLHTGERNGPYLLPVEMVQALQQAVPNSNLVETNTLGGDRHTTEGHRETLKINGWTFCPVDILDEFGEVSFPVIGGRHLKEVAVGKNTLNYDSLIVLTHFKGHSHGGFGGSTKNLAIGMASGNKGKMQVHAIADTSKPFPEWPAKEPFMENLVESAKATCDHFGKNICFINVMRKLSVDCDCAGTRAAVPTIPDVGILASNELLPIEQACIDLVYKMPHEQNKDLVERIESRRGLRQLSYMRELGMGSPEYMLIDIHEA